MRFYIATLMGPIGVFGPVERLCESADPTSTSLYISQAFHSIRPIESVKQQARRGRARMTASTM